MPMKKAEQRAAMKERILDTAEAFFARRGFHGVTLRDVSKDIGVHHSLLIYYFKDKQTLFDAVVARRAPVTIGLRSKALDAYEASVEGCPTVEGALRAFLDTDLDLYTNCGEGWRNYGALGAQVSNTPQWGAKVMTSNFDEIVERLIGLLRKAMPACPDEDIYWGYHFVTGALMLTLGRTGRIDALSHGLCLSDDLPAIKERMATFMAAGFIAICEKRKLAREQ